MRRLLPLLLLTTPVASTGQTAAPGDNPRLTALFDAYQHDPMPPAGQAIGGTQFSLAPTPPTSQKPYDRALIGDAHRAVGVPVLSEQEAQRREWDAKRGRAAPRQ